MRSDSQSRPSPPPPPAAAGWGSGGALGGGRDSPSPEALCRDPGMGERRSLTGRKAARLDVQRLLLRGAWKKGALIDFLLAEEGQARALAKSRAKSPGPLLCHSSPPASLPLRDAQFFPLLWGRRADCLHPTSTQLRGAWGLGEGPFCQLSICRDCQTTFPVP